MSFQIMTDTSTNLPTDYLEEHGVTVVPLCYYIGEREYTCTDTRRFNDVMYYDNIRNGVRVTTAQVPPQRYEEAFRRLLSTGSDILFIGMSSGISGSYSSACVAANEALEDFPERRIALVDTLAASLGEALFLIRALEEREKGSTLEETENALLAMRQSVYQGVLLEDLMYLSRGGRLSGTKAVIGTVLGIKPLLKGNEKGQLVVCGKARGRRRGLLALAEKYEELVKDPERRIVGIAHAGCREDAEFLAERIKTGSRPPREVLVVPYEPVTGAHVGPGTVALFFQGADGARLK